jgi:hypothetical protein
LDWQLPVVADGRRVDVSGSTRWVPTASSGLPLADDRGTPVIWIGALLIGIIAIAAAMRFRRRPRPVTA